MIRVDIFDENLRCIRQFHISVSLSVDYVIHCIREYNRGFFTIKWYYNDEQMTENETLYCLFNPLTMEIVV